MAPPRGKPPAGRGARKAAFPPTKPKKLAKKTYLCSVCSTTFFTLLELQDHLKAGHPTPSEPPAAPAVAIPARRVPNVVPKPQAGRVVKPPRKQPGQTVGKNSAKWFCPVCVKPIKPVHSSSHMVERHLGYATFPKGWVFLCNQCDYRNRNHEARDRHVTLQHQRDPTKERAVFVALTQFQCRFCPHAAANYKALQEHCLNDHVPQD
ncbi:hypothetical protein M3Y99_00113500 [Aphelenchoides fujianensis]|nr:hypothetical protein M3Y99_00113500 [Aphelenchoides fujianensis]